MNRNVKSNIRIITKIITSIKHPYDIYDNTTETNKQSSHEDLMNIIMNSELDKLFVILLHFMDEKIMYKYDKPALFHHQNYLPLPNQKAQKVRHRLLQNESILHDDQCEPINELKMSLDFSIVHRLP